MLWKINISWKQTDDCELKTNKSSFHGALESVRNDIVHNSLHSKTFAFDGCFSGKPGETRGAFNSLLQVMRWANVLFMWANKCLYTQSVFSLKIKACEKIQIFFRAFDRYLIWKTWILVSKLSCNSAKTLG